LGLLGSGVSDESLGKNSLAPLNPGLRPGLNGSVGVVGDSVDSLGERGGGTETAGGRLSGDLLGGLVLSL
jgi:hypothetical protein